MAFPQIATTSSGESGGNATSHPITIPSGTASGDLLIAVLGIDLNPAVTGLPAGWTTLFRESRTGVTMEAYYKTATGSETTFNLGTATSEASIHKTFRITGWQGTPEGLSVNSNTATPDPPSLTPTWGAQDTLWIALACHDDSLASQFTGYPTNYLGGAQVRPATPSGGTPGLGTAYRQINTATEDPGTFAITVASGHLAGVVAISPVLGASTTTEELRPDGIILQTNDTKTLTDLQRDVP